MVLLDEAQDKYNIKLLGTDQILSPVLSLYVNAPPPSKETLYQLCLLRPEAQDDILRFPDPVYASTMLSLSLRKPLALNIIGPNHFPRIRH
jgi:hypothetical protein